MNKKEAIEKMVDGFSGIPQDWVKAVAEAKGEEIYTWPMWGTMWILDYFGEDIYNNARMMVSSAEEIATEDMDAATAKRIKKAIKADDWSVLEDYVDEEMAGARCVLDKDGNTTAMYIYEIDGQYVLGVNGAGWNFYSGVWDKLYALMGLKWHDTKCTHYQCNAEAVEDTDACHAHTFCTCDKVKGKHYKPNCEGK